ncbi:MAG TPA: amylo-alpha-1,6-glucosidase [Candidatus Elarobacter sp.]|nr:amylo-alpha-1,6-glucosidase [Candidatus Elarobacter sp.]
MPAQLLLDLDRPSCGDLAVSEQREWIVTNGLGGFAAGTVAGTLTRRYHGLLFAARTPPVERTLLCPKIDAEVRYENVTYALATDRWHDGTIAPRGYTLLTAFRLEATIPVWTFACGDAIVERRVWMEHDQNRTYVRHDVIRARTPVQLTLHAFANHRGLHGATHAGNWTMDVRATADGIRIVPFGGAMTIDLRADRGSFAAEHIWYRDFDYPVERARGLDDTEDHLRVGTFEATVAMGESMTIAVGDHELPPLDAEAAQARAIDRERELLATRSRRWNASTARNTNGASEPEWVSRLVLAADQFVVRRPLTDDPEASSVIAGYPWFGDWGRDTSIALPGLTLATGRYDIARRILTTFARFVDGGMLPNFFPDGGQPAEYNTVDAALWYVESVRRYVRASADAATVKELFPVLRGIVSAYTAGTRFGIRVDPADGLLRAGEPGVQLTWMDAKVGDWVVTPRIGKPVEVNALWINALRACAELAPLAGEEPLPFASAATRAEKGFERFWSAEHGWCFDVLDGPNGNEPALRPNQIFAVALPIDVLDEARRRAIVDVCSARLWTPAGLRSLPPGEPGYAGRYEGDEHARDAAYHQGTVWTWLAGPFALAHARVYGNRAASTAILAECASGLTADAFGTLGEIADGDPPFTARGAFAQAWSVATVLDAWSVLTE